MGIEEGVYKVLVGEPEEKRPIRSQCSWRRWECNTKWNLETMGCKEPNWWDQLRTASAKCVFRCVVTRNAKQM